MKEEIENILEDLIAPISLVSPGTIMNGVLQNSAVLCEYGT
jgi:hypothetical protein